MAKEINFDEASIYVGTYAKYNNGSIDGKWLKLSDYSDIQEFYEACAKLHEDEEDPEYMFQDYEYIPESLICESWLSEKIFEIRESLEQLEESEKKPFFIWCNNGGSDLSKEDTDDLISSFRDAYIGEYESDEAFAMEDIEDRHDLSDFVKQYFDYEAYARDLFCGSYWSEEGYVFYNS